ncbi:MAG: alanine--glyoxylate aminotransferase family protein [Candidatus Aminicenantes bacterium]|nr:alanine--glyoxylate aminotransferase family protein [Candidatus Aminicenantes bacterium]
MDKLLLIPGPSPVHPRILDALAEPTVSHVSPEMAVDLSAALENLKKTVFCAGGEPFIIAGAGTLAMEIALLNVIAKGDRVLVLSQGYFGDRMGQICDSFGIPNDVVRSPWGSAVRPDELAGIIARKSHAAVSVTHVDTSTGACAPIREYSDLLKGTGILYIVDGVCATGGVEERMDDWGIDVILTAAQKCYGAPPGLALDVFSERAMAKRRGLSSVPAYYSDILRWLPIMKDPLKYFSTPCVNEVRAFAEATRMMLEEGMEARFVRHAKIARAFRAALAALGFTFFTEEAYFADTLSVVRYPAGIEDKAFRSALGKNGVVVAGGLAETSGKVFRLGHMGNLAFDQVMFAVEAVEKTLRSLGYPFGSETGVQAADAQLI